MRKSKVIFSTCLLASALIVSSCNIFGGSDSKLSTADQVKLYCEKDTTSSVSGNVSAYFDFSDGMNWAYQNDTTKTLLQSIVNKITGDNNTSVFSLANNTITPLKKKQTDLYNTIIDASSYQNLNAPIEKTLSKIVKDGNSALMVTDFEEYTPDGKVQHQNFAKPYFEKWLSQGNDITFFITDYVENGLAKHLYYIIFDKKSHSLLSKVEEALASRPVNYKRFLLSTNPCHFTTKYMAAIKGGCYHDENGEDVVSATIEDGSGEGFTKYEGLNAEYYPFGCNWKDIVSNAQAMKEPGVAKPFSDLFRNLFVDLSNQDSYIIKKMDVKAYDVQADFDKFIAFKEALKNKPKMIKDENGSPIADLSGDAGTYYDEKGNMLPDYIYRPQSLAPIEDMLVLNQTLFSNTLKSSPKQVELAIDFNPKFSGEIANYPTGDMIRIDIVVADCMPNYSNLDKLFSWGGNTNLSEAIRNTLQDLNLVNRPVYSYFVKTN